MDTAFIQAWATDNQDKFWEFFYAVFFQFHALNWPLNTVEFFIWCQKMSPLETQKNRDRSIWFQKTRIKDEKNLSVVKMNVVFQTPGFPGRLYQCVISSLFWKGICWYLFRQTCWKVSVWGAFKHSKMCKPVRILSFPLVKTPFQFPVGKEVRFMVCALATTSFIWQNRWHLCPDIQSFTTRPC